MLTFLRFAGSQNIFSKVYKRSPFVENHVKLLLLKLQSTVPYRYLGGSKKAESPIKNTITLYEYDNSKRFNRIRLFSLANFVVWTLFGFNTYDILVKKPEVLDDTLQRKWDENERNRQMIKRLIFAAGVLGFLLLLGIIFYFLRSVKQIQLKRSTNVVIFQTYSFFRGFREFSVPLDNVSGVISRHTAKGNVPIKIKNTLFHFLLDTKGHFYNPFLFDTTIGVKRDFAKSTDV